MGGPGDARTRAVGTYRIGWCGGRAVGVEEARQGNALPAVDYLVGVEARAASATAAVSACPSAMGTVTGTVTALAQVAALTTLGKCRSPWIRAWLGKPAARWTSGMHQGRRIVGYGNPTYILWATSNSTWICINIRRADGSRPSSCATGRSASRGRMATEEVNYRQDVAALSMSVTLEVMTILGAYRDSLVLVGGWAPYFILERFGREDNVF